jgi:two-component system OmpR family sensor kinase
MRFLAAAVRDVQEGILITNAELAWPGPKILFVNEALARITGYSEDELLGATPRMLKSLCTSKSPLD